MSPFCVIRSINNHHGLYKKELYTFMLGIFYSKCLTYHNAQTNKKISKRQTQDKIVTI